MCRPSSPSSSRPASGFTLVELLVTLAISAALTGGALTLALSGRRIYEAEQARTRLNQSLRAGQAFLVNDVRQAGERLQGDFPAIEIRRGEDLPSGAAGDPDELIVRRNLIDTVLWVCDDLAPGADRVTVAIKGDLTLGCGTLPIDPAGTLPINLQKWHDHRTSGGGEVPAYVYDPLTGLGEFFRYDAELEDDSGYYVRKAPTTADWQRSYPGSGQSRIYLLEERRYRLVGDVLQMIVDEDQEEANNLVDGIADFQLRAWPEATESDPDPDPLETFDGIGWTELRSLEVTLRGRIGLRRRNVDREWTAEIMPRNVM